MKATVINGGKQYQSIQFPVIARCNVTETIFLFRKDRCGVVLVPGPLCSSFIGDHVETESFYERGIYTIINDITLNFKS